MSIHQIITISQFIYVLNLTLPSIIGHCLVKFVQWSCILVDNVARIIENGSIKVLIYE